MKNKKRSTMICIGLVLAIMLLLSLAGCSKTRMEQKSDGLNIYTLNNGLTILAKEAHDKDSVGVVIGLRSTPDSQIIDDKIMPGLNSMMMDILLEDLKDVEAYEDPYLTGIGFETKSKDFGKRLYQVFSVFQKPLPDENITKIKNLYSAYSQVPKAPISLFLEDIMKALYPDNILGVPTDYSALAKIRDEKLKEYKKSSFVTRNMVVSVVGNFDTETLLNNLKVLTKNFSRGKADPEQKISERSLMDPLTAFEKRQEPYKRVIHKNVTAPMVFVGYVIPREDNKDDAELFKLKIAEYLLINKLQFELREKGLSYSPSADFQLYPKNAEFTVLVQTSRGNAEEVERIILADIDKAKRKGIEELGSLKIIKAEILMSSDNYWDESLNNFNEYVVGLNMSTQERASLVENMTSDEVRNAFQMLGEPVIVELE